MKRQSKHPAKSTAKKPEPFPMDLFKQLLRRYCRENFTADDIEGNANRGSPWIGVCVGDISGSTEKPIIGPVEYADLVRD